MRRRARAVALIPGVLAGVLALAGCAPTTPMTPTPTPTTAQSPSVSPVASVIASPPPSTTGAIAVDPALLEILPDQVDGQPLRPDDETAGTIARDEALAASIEAIAVGLYIRPGSSTADDLAIVNVVRVRSGVFGNEWFRSWRSTYDDGACEAAGRVAPGGAQTRIGDHETHIGTCQGGVHTYHVHLANPDRVLSITAAGEGRFGERVVAGLTE